MGIEELLKDKREQILRLAEQYGAADIRVFGSVARGEAGIKSDLDLLVGIKPGYTLLDIGGFLIDVQELIGRKVDIVTERGLNPVLRDRILAEAVAL